MGWVTDGANRHDQVLLASTLDALAARGMLAEVGTIWLDRGYDSGACRARLAERGIDDALIAKRRKPQAVGEATKSLPMGLRWLVERTNSWFSNYGQLRRNTDRNAIHQLALAVALLLTAMLIDWRNRWSPTPTPIR